MPNTPAASMVPYSLGFFIAFNASSRVGSQAFINKITMKPIKFRRLSRQGETRLIPTSNGAFIEASTGWEIAFSEADLFARLDGEMAEIVMPAKSWIIRLWRKVRPLRFVEAK